MSIRTLSRFRITLILLAVILVGCRPPSSQQQEPLPTLYPTPTKTINLQDAERVSLQFLDAWKAHNFVEMHRLITFSSREATPLETFIAIYEDSHTSMTLDNLSYTANTLLRQSSRVVSLNYDVTFQTHILGTFTDTGRELQLIIDPQEGQWRIAWSVADIFSEMGTGATLVFDSRIPSRANIYDRNGVVLADQNGVIVNINVIKDDMPDQPTCVATLAGVLDKPPEVVQDQLNRAGGNWDIVIGKIEPQDYLEQQATLEQVCNATFSRQATRQYLRGSLMPHILGHVGFPDEDEVPTLEAVGFSQDTIIGKSGIEQSWDETLRGTPGGRLWLISPTGQRLRLLAEVPSQPSESLWLTIDSALQEYVMRVLGEAYADSREGWGAVSKGGSAIVLDVNTGEVLAMVSWPTFEGNSQNPYPAVGREIADLVLEGLAENEAVPQLNRPAQGVYPTGSVMKVMSSMAVLDSGVYDADSSIVCVGVWQRENDERFDWLPGGHGRMTTETGIINSCNPFFYEVGYQMDGVDPFLLPRYARKLGLGVPTGMTDIPEATGGIPDPDTIRTTTGLPWTFSFAVNLSIGQGEVEVTPLQMVRMYAAVANGGDLLRPQLVRETGILDQRRLVLERDVTSTFDIDQWVLDEVRSGMCGVTSLRSGTAEHIFRNSPLQDLGVCGKTGTAQAAGASSAPHSWFIAYAPQEEPEIATVVMIENSGDGSAIAAPLTRRIMEYYFFGPFDS